MYKNVVLCNMNILVIAATEAEIALSIKHIAGAENSLNNALIEHNGHFIRFAITGIGGVATAYNLTRLLAKYDVDFVIQAGI